MAKTKLIFVLGLLGLSTAAFASGDACYVYGDVHERVTHVKCTGGTKDFPVADDAKYDLNLEVMKASVYLMDIGYVPYGDGNHFYRK